MSDEAPASPDTIQSSTAGDALAAIERARYISVTTFRRTGKGVATPVEFVTKDGAIYVWARAGSGKVKRIRNNPRVRIAPCTMRGRVTGPSLDGVAALMGEAESQALYPLFSREYGFLWRLGIRLRKPRVQGIKIVASPAGAGGG